MLTAESILAALPQLPDPELEAVLEAARREIEARRDRERAETSLTDALDRLSESLTAAMDDLAGKVSEYRRNFSRDLVLGLLVGTGHPYPLVAAAGFKKTGRCPHCDGTEKVSAWPEILGVKVWDWPWQPVDSLTRPGREAYIRGFILSYAPVEKAGVPLILHLSGSLLACECERYSRSYSIYLQVEGESAREVSWAAYRKACARAAEALEELRAAQEKAAVEVKKAVKR